MPIHDQNMVAYICTIGLTSYQHQAMSGGPCQYVPVIPVTFDNTHVLMTQRPMSRTRTMDRRTKGADDAKKTLLLYTTRVATVVSARHLSARLKNGAPMPACMSYREHRILMRDGARQASSKLYVI
jgi:hypothetical protein